MDFYLNSNYEIVIKDGDFVMSTNNVQDAHLLFSTSWGEWKEDIKLGMNIKSFISSKNFEFVIGPLIEEQRRKNNMNKVYFSFDNNNLKVWM